MRFSIVVPCFNEERTITSTVDSLLKLSSSEVQMEIIIVDDHSTDGSLMAIKKLACEFPDEIKVVEHTINKGKGAALWSGFLRATGEVIGIQDADKEYNPQDYLKMIKAISDGDADIVYGSRYAFREKRLVLRYWHTVMNKFLTWFSNMFSDMSLTDMETCYKLFNHNVIKTIIPHLKENRFGFEPEVTALVAKGMRKYGWRIVEIPVEYHPRKFTEGKKIGWIDGLRALWCIVRYNIKGEVV